MRKPTGRRQLTNDSHRRVALQVGACGATAAAMFALLGGGVANAAGPCGSTGVFSGSDPFTCTYSTVGSDTFAVPTDVAAAKFDVIGGLGGNFFIDGDINHPDPFGVIEGAGGGPGGEAAGTLGLTGGSVVQVDVAAMGATATAGSRSGGMKNGTSGGSGALGGFGGSDNGTAGGTGDASGANGGTAFNGGNGGGGGGASDVRIDPAGCANLMCPLSDVAFVGAGGGGVGGGGGQGSAPGGAGGSGGGLNGANGGNGGGGNAGVFGFGATQMAGGAGGLEPALNQPGANPLDPRYGHNGTEGSAGLGGAGGDGNMPCNPAIVPCTSSTTTSGGGAGGGGGGGYFGGGGASGGGGPFGGGGGAGGGGGGGSSFVTTSATNPVLNPDANTQTSYITGPSTGPLVYHPDGSVNGGNGQVTINWTAPQTNPGCTVTVVAFPGPTGPAEEAVTVSDPNGLTSISNIVITRAQVFVGGPTGTRIDPGGTTLSSDPTLVVLTAVKTTNGQITPWNFIATNTEGNTTKCVVTPPEDA